VNQPCFRKNVRALLIAGLLLVATAIPAFAGTPLAGDGNLSNDGSYIGGDVLPFLSVQSDATSSCGTQQGIAVLKFNLGVGAPITGATLSMRVQGLTLVGTGNVVLVPVNDTSFTSSAVGTLDPSDVNLAGPLVTVPFASVPAVGNAMTFSSAALTSYLEGKRGGGVAALGVAITGCSTGNPNVTFDSSSSVPGGGVAPELITIPSAVTMSTFHAADPAVNWPLVAGVGALAAVLIGGLAVARRRAATH
jgi:hypothetical protein